jgi:hypothetical protein
MYLLATISPSLDRLNAALQFYALTACVCGIFISRALWAMGSKGQNPGTELAGKRGIILCCTAAFFIGALPGWMSWLEDLARTADTNHVVPCKNILEQHEGRC